jgi:hypothetical protein
MQAQVEMHARFPRGVAPRRHPSFDWLSLLDSAALESLFATAEAFPFDSLQGHPRGRVLAIPGWDRGPVAALLRGLHASRWWPWEGKSFAIRSGAAGGVGINRVRLPTHRGMFPFYTYPTRSVVDGKPCFAIDYEVPDNPRRVHAIYDEVRRVDDGVYLGRGMRRRPGRDPRLVLWFALDLSIADRPVDFRPRT